MAGSIPIACLLVIASKADAPVALVKVRAAVDEKRILTVVGCLKIGDWSERVSVDLERFERNVFDEDSMTKNGEKILMYSRTTYQGKSVNDCRDTRTRPRAFIPGRKLLRPLGPKNLSFGTM